MPDALETPRRVDPAVFLADEATRLATLAAAILGDVTEAEDAVQESLTAAWRSWKTVRDEGKRHAWLTTICVRQCLRLRRRRLTRGTLPLQDYLGAATTRRDVEWDTAFTSLTDRQRAIVVLHYFYGYTLDECAQLIARRPGTARKHLARALIRLRSEMADD